ncbi:uncharacterized protein [Diadema setosum]|uniref:uncharacterized protein n=1 Tax=Diadema setosum TaxID=31175 RepID=UPI003B3B59DD
MESAQICLVASFTYYTVYLDTGLPIGDNGLYTHITVRFTSTGVIEFWDVSPNYVFQYVNPSLYTIYNAYQNPTVSVFGAPVDLTIGSPRIYFQEYDGRTSPSSSFFTVRDNVVSQIREARSLPSADVSSQAFFDGISYILVITWENVQPPGSAGDETSTYQAILLTNDVHTVILLNFQEGSMMWEPNSEEDKPARIGYSIDGNWRNEFPSTDDLFRSYRPDQLNGTTGLLGRYIYQLDSNPPYYINPRAYCLNWYNSEPTPSLDGVQPCPCSLLQAILDVRFTGCNFAHVSQQPNVPPDLLPGFNRPFSFYLPLFFPFATRCVQPVFPPFGSGAFRCTYSHWGLFRGYFTFWLSSHYQSEMPRNGVWRQDQRLRWIYADVFPRYFCCSRSRSASFCNLYERKRPPSHCRNYRLPFLAWFFGDPHINTLDGKSYTFNGLGEYVMLEYTNGDPFQLQARTGKAVGERDNSGTVFIGFAATQGITTLQVTLNANRTEMQVKVNDSSVDLETLREEGYDSADELFALSVDNDNTTESGATNGTDITAVFLSPTQILSSFKVTFQNGILDLTMYGPSEYAGLGVGRGLLGLWNGDPSDDFLLRNGTILQPEEGKNLSEAEIFEFGKSWTVSADESLFDYGNNSWDDYNDPDFVPQFLDELLAGASTEERNAALELCGDDRSCLFDYLAVGPELGANSLDIGAKREADEQSLNNFPPEITDIQELSATGALMANNTLHVVVGETYVLLITAFDPNNDTITFSLNGTSPQNSSIDDDGRLVWTPANTDRITLDVVASDGLVQSSVSILVKVCLCENNGICDFETEAEGEDLIENRFAVVTCNCTAGWSGDHCQLDIDSCAGDPCFEGVICIDQSPPSTEPSCGNCPPNLIGDGFNCYDLNECSNQTLNDCEQICENTLGSYQCLCYDGYTLNLDRRTCRDIDECVLDMHNCGNNSVCVNTAGSFNCSCIPGYQGTGGNEASCEDINECMNVQHCNQYAVCNNTIGSFTCTCMAGFVGDGLLNCADEDECRDLEVNECHEQATCTNRFGFYTCACDDGWIGDGFECSNIDECENATDVCSPVATCTDTPGSFRCDCNQGYTGNGVMCFDIDECESDTTNNCTFGSSCRNTDGAFECLCLPGFRRTPDGLCEDIDECNLDNCSVNAICTNLNGSFSCECRSSYQGDGILCTDLDECSLKLHDCSQICVNEEMGFSCDCEKGFILDDDNKTCNVLQNSTCTNNGTCGANAVCVSVNGEERCSCNRQGFQPSSNTTCEDINECEGENLCETYCNNTEGGFTCSCAEGYYLETNDRNCTDIDECLDSNACPPHADCVNSDGGFTCLCQRGYAASGNQNESCTNINECDESDRCGVNAQCNDTDGSYFCTCLDGYVGDGMTCVDRDECSEGVCDANADCENTEGSFTCTCRSGYTGSGFDCTDINECSERSSCVANATCRNTNGSFVCTCAYGFRGNAYVECDDINECTEQPDVCHGQATCTNLEGSYNCSCNDGFRGNGLTCEDIDECSNGFCNAFANCSNTIGSAFCTCFDGYELSDSRTCTDFDECTAGVDSCPNDISTCMNTPGDYECNCTTGYRNSSPKTCEDVNECSAGDHNCSVDQVCFNTVGTYRCDCPEMTTEENGVCIAANTIPLVVKFVTIAGLSVSSYADILQNPEMLDKLSEDVLQHLLRSPAANDTLAVSVFNSTVIGSQVMEVTFRVDLAPANNLTGQLLEAIFLAGLETPSNRLEPDNIVFEEVNECEEFADVCGNGVCTDTFEGYNCTCDSGFGGDGGDCTDINECLTEENNCSQICLNNEGGYTCGCHAGFTLSVETCEDINECDDEHGCDHSCNNTEGSYVCFCDEGYELQADGRTCEASGITSTLSVPVGPSSSATPPDQEGSTSQTTAVPDGSTNPTTLSPDGSTNPTTSSPTTLVPEISTVSMIPTSDSDTSSPAPTPEVSTPSQQTDVPDGTTLPHTTVTTAAPEPSSPVPSTVDSSTLSDVSTRPVDSSTPASSSQENTVTSTTVQTSTTTASGHDETTSTTKDTTSSGSTPAPETTTLVRAVTDGSSEPPLVCDGGRVERNGMCAFSQQLTGVVTITQIDGSDATLTNDLQNSSSNAFQELEKNLESAIIAEANLNPDDVEVTITNIASGSIVVSYVVSVFGNTTNDVDTSVASLVDLNPDMLTGGGSTFQIGSFVLNEDAEVTTTDVSTETGLMCDGGRVERNGACAFSQQLMAVVTITQIDGSDATLTNNLQNSSSNAFKELQENLESAIVAEANLESNDVDVTITNIASGSIVVSFLVSVFGSTASEVDSRVASLMALNPDTLTGGGSTYQIGSFVINGTGTTPISTGAIIGIALGCVSFLLLLVAFALCCLYASYIKRMQMRKVFQSTPFRTHLRDDGSSLDSEQEAVQRSIARMNLHGDRSYIPGPPVAYGINTKLKQRHDPHYMQTNFRVPYVVDGSEASYSGASRNRVERNPLHASQKHYHHWMD